MIDIEAIFQEFASGAKDIISGACSQYTTQASSDMNVLLTNTKPLIAQYAQQLSEGKIPKDQFTFAAKGRLIGVVSEQALTEAGIAAVDLDATRQKIVDLAITTLLKVAVI